MKTYALAALLALPALGLASQEASARQYCCGERPQNRISQHYIVDRTAVVFDCDAWNCKTDIRIKAGRLIYARCNNGWCRIISGPFKNAFVLRECLNRHYYRADDEDGGGRDQRRHRKIRDDSPED